MKKHQSEKDIEIGRKKLKAALQEINRWEYEEIMKKLESEPDLIASDGYHDKVLKDCFEAMNKK